MSHKTRIIRYLISGALAAATLLGSLYVLHQVWGMWYLAASAISFVITLIVSFVLQKFWTFANTETQYVHKQFFQYTILACVNLGFNALLMYLFVDILQVWYIVSQGLTAAIISVWSYFIYRVIFHNPYITPQHE